MERGFLRSGRERAVERRHPWVFSGAVERVEGSPALGGTVEVCDHDGRRLGYGSWSPASQIRVRMLSFGAGGPPDANSIRGLVASSIERRRASGGGSPLADGNRGVRLVHGAG